MAIIRSATLPWQFYPVVSISIGLFLAIGLYFLLRHRGAIEIQGGSLTLLRGKKVTRVNLPEVTSIREFNYQIPPSITLNLERQTVSFSRAVSEFADLYKHLCKFVPSMAISGVPTGFYSAKKFYLGQVLGIIAFFYIFMGAIGIFVTMTNPEKNGVNAIIFLAGFATFFGLTGAATVIPWGNYIVEIKIEENALEVENFFKKSTLIERDEIKTLALKSRRHTVRGIEKIDYIIEITFSKVIIQINEQTAKAFHLGIERCWQILKAWKER